MKVEINLYASLARYLPPSAKEAGGIMDVTEGTTIEALIRQLRVPEAHVKLIFVDGTHADRKTVLKEGCRLGIFPPVGGG